MTLTTLIFLLICIGLALLYLAVKIKNNTSSIKQNEYNIFLCEKHIVANTKAIKQLTQNIKELNSKVSSIKYDVMYLNSDLKEKLYSIQERWTIISDERITSIPTTNKEWYEAKQIISQSVLKTWKPKNLTQSKGSVFNTSNEAVNQDFSEMDDTVFEKIMDKDEDKKSSSSGSSKQQLKPRMITP